MKVKTRVMLYRSGNKRCSGAVRLEECECGPAGEEGRGEVGASARYGTPGPSVSALLEKNKMTYNRTEFSLTIFSKSTEN